jgi:hypothetical protein
VPLRRPAGATVPGASRQPPSGQGTRAGAPCPQPASNSTASTRSWARNLGGEGIRRNIRIVGGAMGSRRAAPGNGCEERTHLRAKHRTRRTEIRLEPLARCAAPQAAGGPGRHPGLGHGRRSGEHARRGRPVARPRQRPPRARRRSLPEPGRAVGPRAQSLYPPQLPARLRLRRRRHQLGARPVRPASPPAMPLAPCAPIGPPWVRWSPEPRLPDVVPAPRVSRLFGREVGSW